MHAVNEKFAVHAILYKILQGIVRGWFYDSFFMAKEFLVHVYGLRIL